MQHALKSESGEKFKALYNGQWEELYDSQSDADMGFIGDEFKTARDYYLRNMEGNCAWRHAQ